MRATNQNAWLAGVDGCAGGWIAAFVRPQGGEARVRIVPRFADVLSAPEQPAIVAVDMPIGLPERVGAGGRAAENASGRCSAPGSRRCSRCRRARRSTPPITARPAASRRPPRSRRARCRSSSSTSPPKIREVDECLARRIRHAARRVFEVHPELAFWRLNGGRALTEPKKVKSRPYEPGLALRRSLLIAAGLSGRCRERLAAQRRGGRRSPRCAGLRRHRAADSCRHRAAVPKPAAARRVRTGDGDLGMRFARNSP